VQRGRIDVPSLFDPAGRYRYRGGVNLSSLLGIVAGVAAYYAVPDGALKVLWGIAVAALGYLAARELELRIVGRGPVPTPVSEGAKPR
jgi:cytosine/uracil/thiamine/allantoin permease